MFVIYRYRLVHCVCGGPNYFLAIPPYWPIVGNCKASWCWPVSLASITVSTTLFEGERQNAVYPCSLDLWGTVNRNSSRRRLNSSVVHWLLFLMYLGMQLNSLAPRMARLLCLMFWILLGSDDFTWGMMKDLPLLWLCVTLSFLWVKSGTWSSIIRHIDTY